MRQDLTLLARPRRAQTCADPGFRVVERIQRAGAANDVRAEKLLHGLHLLDERLGLLPAMLGLAVQIQAQAEADGQRGDRAQDPGPAGGLIFKCTV